jgi:squalene-hopene/tetraprenyl-beta-curcumene cyclase
MRRQITMGMLAWGLAGYGAAAWGLGEGLPGQATEPVAMAPNSPDEPLAEKFSTRRALEFLDSVALQWTRERKCGTCHTNYAYLVALPTLPKRANPAAHEIRHFFERRAANWDTDEPRWDTEVVATAITLAIHDAGTTGKLHPITRQALDRMWTLQQEDGAWDWLKCDWPPLEADDYYGAAFVALGVGIAPDSYAESPAAQPGLHRLRDYLRKHAPPSLHHKTMLLWASVKMPDLMDDAERRATIAQLLECERPGGGWSLPSLGDWPRRDGTPNDHSGAPSDGYATGLVVYVLRQTGVPAEHAAIRRGIEWLKTNQRQSGRWFTRSVNNDKYHFIAHAGTAYALMALQACAEWDSL